MSEERLRGRFRETPWTVWAAIGLGILLGIFLVESYR